MKTFCEKHISIIGGVLLLIIMVSISFLKGGVHGDELFTFALANSETWPMASIVDFNIYNGEEFFNDSFSAVDNEFNYKNTYEKQASDVHPPMYYYIIHTLCSIFSNPKNLVAVGLGWNIFMAICVYFIMNKIVNVFIENKTYSAIISLLFCLTFGILDGVYFMRMYVWLLFLYMTIFYLFIKYEPKVKRPAYFYVLLYVITAIGGLTHYFYIPYIGVISLVFGILLLRYKKVLDFFVGIVSVLGGLLTSYLLFPEMEYHIFQGYRGAEAIGYIKAEGFRGNVLFYIDLINQYLFGGAIVIIAIIIIAGLIVNRKKLDFKIKNLDRYIIMVATMIIMVIAIMKAAPYQETRYMYAIYYMIFLAVYLPLYNILGKVQGKSQVIFVAVLAITTLIAFRNPIPKLYLEGNDNSKAIETYCEDDSICVYVYNIYNRWIMHDNMLDINEFENVMFIGSNKVNYINQNLFEKYDNIVLYLDSSISIEASTLLEQIRTRGDRDNITELFEFGYSKTYLIN